MAEKLTGYESTEVRRQYRAADLSGQRAAVNELGRSASALSNLAGASSQQARVLEGIGNLAYSVGAELAQQRGEQKPLPQMRDQNGDMVPMVQTQTLSIEQQAYQQRSVQAWANEAEAAYREETNRAWGQYNTEPDRFREHMGEYRTKLLANAPDSIRTGLTQRLDAMGEGRAFGLDQSKFARDRKAGDMAITSNLDNDFRDMHSLVLRDADIWIPTEGGRVPNPEILAKQDDMLERIEALSNVNPAVVESLQRKISLEMFLAETGKHLTNLGNSVGDDLEYQERANIYEDEVLAGNVTVPGFADGERKAVSIRDLPLEEQDKVRNYVSARKREVLQNIREDQAVDHDRFRYGAAKEVVDTIVSNSVRYPQEYERIIAGEAGARGVDIATVRAMIGVESGGNPNARINTRKGGQAIGLMQMTTDTFNRMLPGGNIEDPGDNLRAGITYIDKLGRQVEKVFPGVSQFDKAMLITAGYYGGEGRLADILDLAKDPESGVNISDYMTWGPYNVNRWTTTPSGRKVKEPTEAEHLKKFRDRYLGSMGGNAAMVEAFKLKAQEAYGHSPRQYVQVMGAFYQDLRAALNQNEVNRNLVYQPQAFDTGMGKRYVDARWNRSFDAADPSVAYMSVMDSLPPDAPGYQMIKSEAHARKMRALGTGNSTGAKFTRQLMAQSGESFTAANAQSLDAQLPQDQFMTGQTNMVAGVSQLTAQALGQTGNNLQAATDMASDYLVNRWTFQGRLLNGRVPMEAIKTFSLGIDQIAGGQLDPATQLTLIKALGHFTDAPPVGTPSTGVGFDNNSARFALDNIARINGGPTHSNAPEANIKRAIRFLNRNGTAIVEKDPKARQKLNDILAGNIPEDAYAKLPQEQKTLIDETYPEIVEDAFPEHMRAFAERIPNLSHVDPAIEQLVKDRAASLAPQFSADEMDLSVPMAIEQLVREGRIGGSQYTYNQAIMFDKDYRPAGVTFTSEPVEWHFRHQRNALPTPEVYAMLDDETREGTLYGQTQKVLDALPGPLRGAMEEHRAGRLAWLVTKGGKYPQVLAMHKVKAGGTDGYDWVPLSMIDTKPIVDMDAAMNKDNQFHRDVNAAYAEAYNFFDPRDREDIGWIRDMLTKGTGYMDDWSPYDLPVPGLGMANLQGAVVRGLGNLFTRELPPIAEYVGGSMPGSPEMVGEAIGGLRDLSP